MDEWKPIETAPLGRTVLLWWVPRTDPSYLHAPEDASTLSNNRHAECCVVGQVSAHEKGKRWNARGEYEDIERVTHWMNLPNRPEGT